MKKICIILMLCAAVTGLTAQVHGKRPTPYGFDVNVKPPIYYDIYFSVQPGNLEPEINFMLNIQYDLLFFTRTDSGYSSQYNISLYIKSSETQETVFSYLWREKVHENNFRITNSREHYHLNAKKFNAAFAPGNYLINLELTDETSRDGFRSQREIQIPDLSTGDFISEIVFITEDKTRSAEIVLDGSETILEFNADIYPYFEAIFPENGPVSLSSELYRIENDKNVPVRTKDYQLELTGNQTKHLETIERAVLDEGDYLLKYKIQSGDSEKEIEKKFSIVWYKKPVYLYDIEMAVLPMKYILSESEWEQVNDFSDREKEKWFKEFWKSKDPNMDTPLNEVQIEFYNRVSNANRKFRSEDFEGWDTDRGKSLILYGEPDRIEAKHYLDNAQPYEIWYYESQNKKLIFIDKDADRSFRLVSIEEIGEKNE